MITKIIIITLLPIVLPIILVVYLTLILLWYPATALLRFVQRDTPYPHEYMEAFVKGELRHAR